MTTEQPPIHYKPLRTTFRSKGFDYRQLERKGDVALFEQTKSGVNGTWFEVVIVQRHDGYAVGNNVIEPAETMPSASMWGRAGWTYRDESTARAKFEKLVQ